MKTIAFIYLGCGTYHGQPIGLLCLSAWVKKYCPGWAPIIVDGSQIDATEHLLTNYYDVVAISSMTPQYEKAKKLASTLKNNGLKSKLIIGGVHITTLPDSITSDFDIAITGEGEYKLENYLNGIPLKNEKNVDLNAYPDLDYSLLSNHYFIPHPVRLWQGVVIQAMMITSRGCPYDCRFCSTTNFWKSYRTHSPEWVIRQMNNLTERGVTHIQIFDDLFTVNKKWLKRLADLFVSEKVKIKGISIQSRANTIDQETIDILKAINCKNISFGFESGSERMLQYLKKTGCSIKINKNAINITIKNKLRVCGSVMLGNPGETVSDMVKTGRFILWGFFHGLSDIWPYVTTPYPGTEFWKMAEAKKFVDRNMNFDLLKIHSKYVGPAMLIDIPKWQFIIVWIIIQTILLPYKIRKASNILLSIAGIKK